MKVQLKINHKYEVLEDVFYITKLLGNNVALYENYERSCQVAHLGKNGILTIYKGATWDGPSGPAIDSCDFLDASLAHDYLYHMIASGCLHQKYRKEADRTLRHLCKKFGMPWIRRQWVYWAVRLFGRRHTHFTFLKGIKL